MKKTNDYSLFGMIGSNREVDQKHVNKLKAAIKKNNLLALNPIVVDKYKRIIDGQHRLEAAKQLGLEVYYIQGNDLKKQDIADLNSVKKNWSMMDYVNYYTVEKAPGFNVLSKFLNDYPEINVSSAVKMISMDGHSNSKGVRDGKIDVRNIEHAYRVARFLKWLRNYYDYAYNSSVMDIISTLFEKEGFDEEYFKSKILDQPRSLTKCINRHQYKEMFLEVYNYKLSKNRLDIK
ncbi:MAG: ParB N-terminal domain-containing protein [Pseudosphingobacterium sp.]|nr:ParB N-terminal domain-containing protein [Pseudosphingobacterium sp.]